MLSQPNLRQFSNVQTVMRASEEAKSKKVKKKKSFHDILVWKIVKADKMKILKQLLIFETVSVFLFYSSLVSHFSLAFIASHCFLIEFLKWLDNLCHV